MTENRCICCGAIISEGRQVCLQCENVTEATVEIIRYDEATKEWFRHHGDVQTTVCRCEVCGLCYKPSLGHKCKGKKRGK